MDAHTQEFIVQEYGAGNGESTVTFIKHLQKQRPGKRLVLIWDGVSYHKSEEMKAFLTDVNAGQDARLCRKDLKVTNEPISLVLWVCQ